MSKRRSKIARRIRIAILLSLLAGAVLLFCWSRSDDPKFYYFLTSVPGRVLGRVFRWNNVLVKLPEADKPEKDLTPEERAVKQKLEAEIEANRPADRLIFRNGTVMQGKVMKENPEFVVFREDYRESGALTMKIHREKIDRIEPNIDPLPSVAYSDIRFRMAFPEMNFYKKPPYSLITDESYFIIKGTVWELQKLHGQFFKVFKHLARFKRQNRSIQIVFFSNESAFRRYQKKFAPRMEEVTGFYSPVTDRLIVFNQKRPESGRQNLPQAMAERQTLETIRHEGAHQLLFGYGIHSGHRIENEWLLEGLATYCETRYVGQKSEERIRCVRSALVSRKQIPLAELLEIRGADGFFTFKTPELTNLAYAQSWLLVHYLMSKHKDAFFEYIRHMRDRKNFWAVAKRSRFELLCEFVGTSPDQFVKDWLTYAKRL